MLDKNRIEHLVNSYTLALQRYKNINMDSHTMNLCSFYSYLRSLKLITFFEENLLDYDINKPNQKALSLMDFPISTFKWSMIGKEAHEKRTAFLKGMLDYYTNTLQSLKDDDKSLIRQQYDAIKEKHKDALVLFRCFDRDLNYNTCEVYYEDAKIVSDVCKTPLTIITTYKGTFKSTGFDFKYLDDYLTILVIEKGYKVVLCGPDNTLTTF